MSEQRIETHGTAAPRESAEELVARAESIIAARDRTISDLVAEVLRLEQTIADLRAKTEAHPYHHGRGMRVYDTNCPLCRDDAARETTYVSWSLYQQALDRIARLESQLNCEATPGQP